MPSMDSDSMQTLAARRRFDSLVSGAPQGDRLLGLRDQAQGLADAGRLAESFAVAREMAALFGPEDRSAAASVAWYELAEAYRRFPGIDPRETLTQAVAYHHRALESEARRRDPRRHAMTLHALGSVLRELAGTAVGDGPERRQTLEEAERLMREAVKVGRTLGRFFSDDLAGYRLGLANVLALQGRRESALKELQIAERIAAAGGAGHSLGQRGDVAATIRVTLAGLLLERGRRPDRKKAQALLRKAILTTNQALRAQARLLMARSWILQEDAQGLELARKLLHELGSEDLELPMLASYVELCERAGMTDVVLFVLERKTRRLFELRRDTRADVHADHAAETLQDVGWLLASTRLREGDTIGAFLALERVSGLRLMDMYADTSWRPSDALSAALFRNQVTLSQSAVGLDDLASMAAHGGADAAREALDMMASASAEELAPLQAAGLSTWAERLHAVRAAPDIREALRGWSDELMHQATAARAALEAHDPSVVVQEMAVRADLDAPRLRSLLQENPDALLLRVVLRERLVALGVWLDGDSLASATVELPVPAGLVTLLHERSKSTSTTLDEVLLGLDLGPAMGPGSLSRMIVLPSGLAGLLPIIACGPIGARPVDRFTRVSWMPCLSPLRGRLVVDHPREGTLLVAPPVTKRGHHAFRRLGASEVLLDGAGATLAALVERAPGADVVAFYTHCKHRFGLPPEVQLSDQWLTLPDLDIAWSGMERVELWACQSGRAVPSDPRQPLVDELLGADGLLLLRGARSTIGTLWPVLERVTVCLLHAYRQELGAGALADEALLSVQRWWYGEGAQQLLDRWDAPDATLGPAPEPSDRPTLDLLRDPRNWAGYRLSGACERRPLDDSPWPEPEDDDYKAARARAAAVTSARSQASTAGSPQAELVHGLRDRPTTIEDALTLVAMYDAETAGERAHRLLMALAWLYDGLRNDPEADPRLVRRARLDAAHLWLELALERAALPGEPATIIDGRLVEHASAQLAQIPGEAADTSGARAFCALFASRDKESSTSGLISQGFPSSWPEPIASRRPDLDSLTLWCRVATRLAASHPDLGRRCLALAARFDGLRPDGALLGGFARLSAAAARLAVTLGTDAPLPLMTDVLSGAPHADASFAVLGQLAQSNEIALQADAGRVFGELQTDRENGVWGHWRESPMGFARSTGGVEPGHRQLAHHQHQVSAARLPPAQAAIEVLACMQMVADLRCVFLNRLSRITPAESDLWLLACDRERLMRAMLDAALEREGAATPVLDLAPNELLSTSLAGSQEASFNLASIGSMYEFGGTAGQSRPAAAQAALIVETANAALTQGLAKIGRALDADEPNDADGADLLARALGPTLRIEGLRRSLADVPPGVVRLGISTAQGQETLLVASWRGEGGPAGRVERIGPPMTQQCTNAAIRVLGVAATAQVSGESGRTATAWRELAEHLDAPIERVLGPALEAGARRLEVFAPAAWRVLPLWMLTVEGRPLLDLLESVQHLPTLDAPPPVGEPAGPPSSVLLATTSVDASRSPFTAAVSPAIAGLVPGPVVRLERTHRNDSRDIEEADQLQEAAPGAGRLIILGEGAGSAATASTAGVALSDHRKYRSANFRNIRLRTAKRVDIWADSAGAAQAETLARGLRDAVPGLVWDALATGAASVLDLAWEVPDLVKALVAEQYYLVQAASPGGDGGLALGEALRSAAAMLGAVRSRAAQLTTPPALLRALDAARETSYRSRGISRNSASLASSEPCLRAIGPDVAGWIDHHCASEHLAAFRFWAWSAE